MKNVSALYTKWCQKRRFEKLISTTDERLLLDIGLNPERVRMILEAPFWKFQNM